MILTASIAAILIAQALAEKCSIVSADPAFDAYPITRLW